MKQQDKDEWWLYLVRCASGALYCGIAKDVEARVTTHNAGMGAKAVKALGMPVTLAFKAFAGTRSNALKMERMVKAFSKDQKEHLVRGWAR